MNSPVDKIKERLSIVDVISSYLTLEQSGKNYKAKCPFHNEKTPSFFVSTDRGTYYCFGCGEKGDIFSFVQKFEGIDFFGSLKLLADRAGVIITKENNDSKKDDTLRYYEIMEEATLYFENNLNNFLPARSYLLSRGVLDSTIKSFRIGYAPESWRSVSDYLIKKGYKKEDLEIVGLIKKKDGDSFYDRFRSRIMFPISDSSGRVIAFSGRIINISNQNTNSIVTDAKYLNSPDTPLFNKSNVLFGIDKAKNGIRNRGYSIVVEGQMDLIMSHQAGFTNTVAVSGTALADNTGDNNENKINNLGLIRRLSPNVIFAYDGDGAGLRASNRSAMIALSLDMQVKIANLPEGKDPADIIKDDPEYWKNIIKNSLNIISFYLDKICRDTNDIRLRGKKVREIIFPLMLMIKSSIERSAYINEIYSKTGISEKAINEDFNSYENSKEKNIQQKYSPNININKESRRDKLERRLFGIIFWQNKNNGNYNEIINKACENFKESIGVNVYDDMFLRYNSFSDVLSFESEIWYGDKTNIIESDIKEIILNLEEEIVNENMIKLLDLINQKEKENKKEELNLLIKDYQKMVEKIQNIKSRRLE